MTTAPAQARPAGNAWFIAWLVGGVVVVMLAWVLAEVHYDEDLDESVFMYVGPPGGEIPGSKMRRMLFERIIPYGSLAYALVGVWFFRRRGCLAVMCAGVITCCPYLSQLRPP
jgi:hypothetical protein